MNPVLETAEQYRARLVWSSGEVWAFALFLIAFAGCAAGVALIVVFKPSWASLAGPLLVMIGIGIGVGLSLVATDMPMTKFELLQDARADLAKAVERVKELSGTDE